MKNVLLPGLNQQINFLFENLKDAPQRILIIGAGSELIAAEIASNYKTNVDLIVEENESLINSRILLKNNSNVSIKLMSFESTDYSDNYFDLIYAQASISLTNRNKIVKEIKRILKHRSFFCVGELISLKKDIPPFMKNIFNSSNLLPLFKDDLEKYYIEKGFITIEQKNLSTTLKEYYSLSIKKLKSAKEKLSEMEKSYYKKLFNKITHEANAYLKLGGDKYLGFHVLLLKKGEN